MRFYNYHYYFHRFPSRWGRFEPAGTEYILYLIISHECLIMYLYLIDYIVYVSFRQLGTVPAGACDFLLYYIFFLYYLFLSHGHFLSRGDFLFLGHFVTITGYRHEISDRSYLSHVYIYKSYMYIYIYKSDI